MCVKNQEVVLAYSPDDGIYVTRKLLLYAFASLREKKKNFW